MRKKRATENLLNDGHDSSISRSLVNRFRIRLLLLRGEMLQTKALRLEEQSLRLRSVQPFRLTSSPLAIKVVTDLCEGRCMLGRRRKIRKSMCTHARN